MLKLKADCYKWTRTGTIMRILPVSWNNFGHNSHVFPCKSLEIFFETNDINPWKKIRKKKPSPLGCRKPFLSSLRNQHLSNIWGVPKSNKVFLYVNKLCVCIVISLQFISSKHVMSIFWLSLRLSHSLLFFVFLYFVWLWQILKYAHIMCEA